MMHCHRAALAFSLVALSHGLSPVPEPQLEVLKSSQVGNTWLDAGSFGCDKCHQSDSDCSLEWMKTDDTCVYPDPATSLATCLDGPFAFKVMPGDKDKMLFFFQAGGACTGPDQVHMQCTLNLLEGGIAAMSGVFNKTDVKNPFRNYTIVNIPYCSGDAFAGNSSWAVGNQFGYQNARAVVEWGLANAGSTPLSSLLLMGSSAGSLGTQFWSRNMLRDFKYESAAVVADSYAGIFPQGGLGQILANWKSCDLPLWTPEAQALCLSGAVTVPVVFNEIIADYPCVAFSNIQSKADLVQFQFYCMVEPNITATMECGSSPTTVLPYIYAQANLAFQEYSTKTNYVAYIVDGDQHTFFLGPEFYTASTLGKDTANEPMLFKWAGQATYGYEVEGLTLGTVSTQCSGPLAAANATNGVQYCDEDLIPKNFSLSSNCATTPAPAPVPVEPTCFPGQALVQTLSPRGSVPVALLSAGDFVLGELAYEPVIGLLHDSLDKAIPAALPFVAQDSR